MAEDRTATRWALALIAAGLVLVLAVQMVTPLAAPAKSERATQRVLGQAGFAYLGGLRTLVAALLWNRLEPQFHEIYAGGSLGSMTFMLPTMRIVTWLDPQFEHAYYVGQWIIAEQGKVDEALAMTREGMANNPHSGRLRASYAQMLLVFAKDRQAAHKWAVATLAPDVKWASPADQWESYAILRDIFRITKDSKNLAIVMAEIQRLDRTPGVVRAEEEDFAPLQGAP